MALLSADELSAADRRDLTLLDVRWSLAGGPAPDEYATAHLAGAVFMDFDAEICGPPGAGGRHPLPEPHRLQEALRRAGVNDDGSVVVYDGGDLLAAGRTWWTLRWAGLTDVHVVDGGYPAAVAAGYPTESGPVTSPPPGKVTVRPGGMPVLDADAAARLARRGGLFDVRTAARFRGEQHVMDPVAGHIPGAGNLPGEQVLAEDARGFHPPARLAELFAGVDAVDSGLYCGSGVTAARSALAMTAAGMGTPAVYIGSWSDWITDPTRPVATDIE